MIRTVCPDREQLLAYTLGKLSEPDLEATADHVEGCPTCQATLHVLASPEDTIVAGLREAAATDLQPTDPAYQAAVAKVEAMADGELPATIGLSSEQVPDPADGPDRKSPAGAADIQSPEWPGQRPTTAQQPLGQLREYQETQDKRH